MARLVQLASGCNGHFGGLLAAMGTSVLFGWRLLLGWVLGFVLRLSQSRVFLGAELSFAGFSFILPWR